MPFSPTADLGKTLLSIATLYFTFKKGRLQLIVSSTGNLHNSFNDPTVDTRKKKSSIMRKPMFWFQTWSCTNQAVQSQKMVRGMTFRI